MLTIITAPSSTVVSLADVKTWLRIDTTDDNALLTSLLRPAELEYERRSGRATLSTTYEDVTLTGFIGRWWFPRQPYISLTSVTVYEVEDATSAAMATADYRLIETPAGMALEIDTLEADEYARVRWIAGQTSVEPEVSVWIKHWVAREYAFRGDDTSGRSAADDRTLDRLLHLHSTGGLL